MGDERGMDKSAELSSYKNDGSYVSNDYVRLLTAKAVIKVTITATITNTATVKTAVTMTTATLCPRRVPRPSFWSYI